MRFKTKLGTCLAMVGVAAVASTVSTTSFASTAAGATQGGTWGLSQPLPGLSGTITAITCTAPGDCVAAGYTVTGSGRAVVDAPIVATQTAGTWGSVQPVGGAASLGSGTGARLTKVSCGAAGDCTAIGEYNGTDGRDHAWFVSETAGAWGAATAVSEAGQPGTYSVIMGVSCRAASYCAVDGDYITPATTTTTGSSTPFILDEAGGTWDTPQPVPGLSSLPSAGGSATLYSVSCAEAGDCTAAGGYTQTSGAAAPFVVTEKAGTGGAGAAWGSARPVTSTAAAVITSLSCPDATDCTAAGLYLGSSTYNQVFTVDEQQGTWGAADLLGNPSLITVDLPQLACASAGNCVLASTAGIQTGPKSAYRGAVADTETSSGDWGTITPIPVPASTVKGAVTLSNTGEVSCAPHGDCTIAGYYNTAESVPLTMFAVTSTDGVLGNLQPVTPAMGALPAIVGLACPRSGYCTLAYNLSGAPEVVTEATAATVRLTASAPTLTYGSEPAETLTATVSSPAGGTPTGTVTITGPDGRTLCPIALSGGTGTCDDATPALPGGVNTLSATYSGDANYVAAGAIATVTVNRAATTTSLGISPASATFSGKNVTVTFATTVTSAAGTPAGLVGAEINGKSITNCDADVLTAAKVTCTTSTFILTPGRYALTVDYSGNADFAPSTSAIHYLTVSKARTTTTLTLSKTTVTYGHESAEKITVSVSHVGATIATGKVSVRIGGTTICTISLTKGTGSCTLGNTRLRAGTYRFAGLYPGNGDYNSSTSASKTLKVG